MTWLEKNRQLISKRDKERRSNYFCSKLFLANIPFMVQHFEKFTNNGLLDWCYEKICLTLFHSVPIFPFYTPQNYQSNFCFFYVFWQYKKGTLGRNNSSFSTHFSPVLFFYTPYKPQKNLDLLQFPGGIKSKHLEEIGEIMLFMLRFTKI